MMAVCEICYGRTLTPKLVNGRTTCGKPECVEGAERRPHLDIERAFAETARAFDEFSAAFQNIKKATDA